MLTCALVGLLVVVAGLAVAGCFEREPRVPSLLDLLRSQSESGPFSSSIADTRAGDTETSDFRGGG